MGYRSQVCIRIKHNDPNKFKTMLVELFIKQLPWVAGIKSTTFEEFTWNESEIHIEATDWKWYDTYDEVKWCEDLWAYFDKKAEEDKGLNGIFIRIGEETNDIEDRYFNKGYELANVSREINIY